MLELNEGDDDGDVDGNNVGKELVGLFEGDTDGEETVGDSVVVSVVVTVVVWVVVAVVVSQGKNPKGHSAVDALANDKQTSFSFIHGPMPLLQPRQFSNCSPSVSAHR